MEVPHGVVIKINIYLINSNVVHYHLSIFSPDILWEDVFNNHYHTILIPLLHRPHEYHRGP